MSSGVVAEEQTGAASPATAWRRHRRVGWFLLVAWMVLLTSAVFVGARESSLAELREDVASGEVDAVRISEGLSEVGRGYATVKVTWQRGILRHTTQVIEARPLSKAPRPAARDDDVTGVVEPPLVEQLVALDPDLRVDRGSISELSSETLGWRFPNTFGLVGVGLFLSTLFLLVLGPQPWRATRWAWFWLLGLGAPVVMVAYLLVGGPTSAVPPPRDPSRRLTGGWAFLISVVLGSALTATLFT